MGCEAAHPFWGCDMASELEHPSSENWLVAVGTVDPNAPRTSLQLDSGRIVSLPTELLLEKLEAIAPEHTEPSEQTVIPVLAEELVVTKRRVPVETVRLVKTTESHTEQVEVPLEKEHWEVTRVPVDAEVTARSATREEDGRTIYPVYEERILTRTALFLVEEIHLQKVSETVSQVVEGVVRREVLTVERITP